ncbi:uncharacterized protein LOC113472353 [Diaphorina citri]|uniref:Uncharacterized protein LOC113472353 n=1 Tax=Diaphorina citri TaxID=121845 RepID=A0A3Q0JM07_DIACI|nr:uncharacterized protein LOC113472353 [Diaphorina citri]
MGIYFKMKKVTDQVVKGQVLLTSLTPKLYQMVADLSAPGLPEEKSFDELCQLLTDQLCPKPNEISEQNKFVNRVQAGEENISQFVVALKHQARTCHFFCESCEATTMDTHLRCQFVRGIRDENIRQKLLQEDSKTNFNDLVKLAVNIESSQRDSKQMKMTSVPVCEDKSFDEINKVKTSFSRKCRSCGGVWPHMKGKPCPAATKTCFKCHKSGHFSPQCRSSGVRNVTYEHEEHQLHEEEEKNYEKYITSYGLDADAEDQIFAVQNV